MNNVSIYGTNGSSGLKSLSDASMTGTETRAAFNFSMAQSNSSVSCGHRFRHQANSSSHAPISFGSLAAIRRSSDAVLASRAIVHCRAYAPTVPSCMQLPHPTIAGRSMLPRHPELIASAAPTAFAAAEAPKKTRTGQATGRSIRCVPNIKGLRSRYRIAVNRS